MNRMMGTDISIPSDWVCNANKKHVSDEGVDCKCCSCLQSGDSKLIVGSPQSTSSSMLVEMLKELGFVGMYERRPEFYIPCSECGESVPVSNSDSISAVRSGGAKLYHWKCSPEKMDDRFAAPYILFGPYEESKESSDGETEEGSGDICGANGGGAEEERLPGTVEESESGDDPSEVVG